MQFDDGALYSLIFTVISLTVLLLVVGKKPKDFFKYLKGEGEDGKKDSSIIIVTSILLGIGFVAVWLTVRIGGAFVKGYLTDPLFQYNQYQILDMISYLLIANLCFNLIKNLKKETHVRDITSAAIQAVLIGIIVLIPKYGDLNFLTSIGGQIAPGVFSFFLIILSVALILLSLAVVSKYLKEPSDREREQVKKEGN